MGEISIVKRADGGLCVSRIAREQLPDETDTEFLRACTRRVTGDPISPGYGGEVIGIFDESAIPVDRYFRSAWTWNTPDPVIDIDMPKARGIHLGFLRMKRNAQLSALDVEYQKALEKNDQTLMSQIADKKQGLRDMPETIRPRLDAAGSADELRRVDYEPQ
jgi:hypothetical protein